jgi:chitin disaccharide deacetylase
MKHLIVNADDLGADEARNAGIVDAIQAGSVTSVSILANGPAFDDGIRRLHSLDRNRVSFGLHLNLSQGKALSPDARLLVGPDGCFLGKESARRLFSGRTDTALELEIRSEIESQFAALAEAGIVIDHLDGHQHAHVFPLVVRAVLEITRAHAIRWIRIPEETECHPDNYSAAMAEEARIFNRYASAARPRLQEFRLCAPEHFRGLYMKGNLPASSWVDFLESLPDGLTELMVHPGHAAAISAGPFSQFSTPDRELELQALIDGRFQQAFSKTGVRLTTFPKEVL